MRARLERSDDLSGKKTEGVYYTWHKYSIMHNKSSLEHMLGVLHLPYYIVLYLFYIIQCNRPIVIKCYKNAIYYL